MKNFIKNNLKIILAFIFGILVTASISVYAAVRLQANQIEYNEAPLDEVLDDLYNGAFDFSKFTTLWKPIPVRSGNITYSGTYTFNQDYRLVIIMRYTNNFSKTSFSVSGMSQVFYGDCGIYAEGSAMHVYKNVKSGSKVSYSINGLTNAGIGVFGVK